MRVSYGKWTKHKLMSQDERLIGYLPETKYFNQEALWSMLEKHKQVMLKPCYGYQGIGIVQLSALEGDRVEIHKNYKRLVLNGKDEIFSYLKQNHFSKKRKPRYIVQQRIPLATINDHPFDIRIMVQRKKDSSEWGITGMLAKIAANNYVITNAAKAVISVEEALNQSNLNKEHTPKIISELEVASLLAAQHLANSYPKQRVYGIDLGIDCGGKVWIIEANLSPATSMFKLLKDDSYETIRSYKKG